MIKDRRVFRILESMADSGQTADQACAGYPELLSEVRMQLDQCRRIDAQMDALFGPSSSDDLSPPDEQPDRLPSVPGYHIIALLGQGGMGIVYRALHLELNRTVALKMMRSGVCATAVERARFVREARAIACLGHENIVQVFDVGEVDGCPFFTMEFVAGKTLSEFMRDHPPSAKDAAALLIDLAGAVRCAHENGIVHRDLKPSNVFIDTERTPKIGDFGLARSCDDDGTLTLSGVRIGTPSYMAPEQAAGRVALIGPAADIYSLGAILYEALTGRPPFRGESIADIERQLLTEEPIPPSRLNRRVPRSLETICLKCLRKQPHRRYQSAAEFADDLNRFQRGEPVLARNAGGLERAVKWMRRHPAITTGITAATLIVLLIVGTAAWWFSQRAAKIRSVNESLNEAVTTQQQGNWAGAQTALDHAAFSLGAAGPLDLKSRLAQAERDSKLAERLNEIRIGKCRTESGDGNYPQTDEAYAAAFKEAGLGSDAETPAVVANRIINSNIRQTLLDALDDWAICLSNERCFWILDVACSVDPQARVPKSWRAQCRDANRKTWYDRERIHWLVETADVEKEPVALLLGLNSRYVHAGYDPLPFVSKIQRAHPGDFWANLLLGNMFSDRKNYPEAIRYFQAAIAIRPDAAVAYHNVGKVMTVLNRTDEAIADLGQAVRLNPSDPVFNAFLGIVLWRERRFTDAMPHLEIAVKGQRDDTIANLDLGDCYSRAGRNAEATEQYVQAIGLKPKLSKGQEDLRRMLVEQNQFEIYRTAWQWTLRSKPAEFEPYQGFAELCLALGDKPLYHKECARLIDMFANDNSVQICTAIASACLLEPENSDSLESAITLVNRAVSTDPHGSNDRIRFVHGLAEYRAGHFEQATSLLQGEFSPSLKSSPKLVLAMAQFRSGQSDLARSTLAEAVRNGDWNPKRFSTSDNWTAGILRHEAESLILKS